MLTGIYAAFLAILYVFLTIHVIRSRWKHKVGLGDAGNKELTRAIRIHGNFSEYVPLSILLIYFNEIHTAPTSIIHILGSMLVIGRLLHAYGLSQSSGTSKGRFLGMSLTFGVLLFAAFNLLRLAF